MGLYDGVSAFQRVKWGYGSVVSLLSWMGFFFMLSATGAGLTRAGLPTAAERLHGPSGGCLLFTNLDVVFMVSGISRGGWLLGWLLLSRRLNGGFISVWVSSGIPRRITFMIWNDLVTGRADGITRTRRQREQSSDKIIVSLGNAHSALLRRGFASCFFLDPALQKDAGSWWDVFRGQLMS